VFNTTGLAVNHIDITNAATGNSPILSVEGDDADIDFTIAAKGTGNILFDGSNVICGNPGTEASGININGVTYNSTFKVSNISATDIAQTILHRHSTTLQPLIVTARSNSDTDAHVAVTNGMPLFSLYASGWTASHYDLFGAINIGADATGTISSTSSPGSMSFQVTADGSNTPTTWLSVTNNKAATFAGNVTIGTGSNTLTLNSSTAISAIIDDDTFATASATNVPTAESVKAYVDGLDSGSVKSVTGTSNEVDVDNTDAQNPVLSLSSTINAPGTFTVQSTIAIDAIIDDDTFATATATNIPTAESVKAYVDGVAPVLTDGQVLIGDTGNPPQAATLTPGTGISIAGGAGSITISATGGGFAVATVAGTSQTAAVNTMYILLNAGQTTVTLPSTFSVGDSVVLVGSTANTGGWVLTAETGDTITYNGAATTAGGTITCSALSGQTIEVVADVANTSWVVTDTVNTLLTLA